MTDKENQLSFTASFHFQSGHAFFDGFTQETVVSVRIKAKYRVLVKNPEDDHMYTMKGMEKPLSQEEIRKVLKEKHQGSIHGEEFAFEVFDEKGERLFATKFNAQERIPPDGFESNKVVYTSFSWVFELPEGLRL